MTKCHVKKIRKYIHIILQYSETAYDVENTCSGLEQKQKYSGVTSLKGIQTFPF